MNTAPATARRETTLSEIPQVNVRRLGLVDYEPTWRAMQSYTAQRDNAAADEIWLLEHRPVYTVGLAGRPEHLPRGANGIPVIRTDRGGQITYHGPGQAIAYLLLDMRRRGLSIRPLVLRMEQAVIRCVLERTGGNQLRAARLLGMGRNTLRRKMTQLGIAIDRVTDGAGGPVSATTEAR